jgi:MFS family permease
MEILIAAHLLFGAGFGLLLPGLQAGISLKASSNDQAAVSGYLAAATTLGYVIGPSVGGFIYSIHPPSTFLAAVCLIAIALLLSVFLPPKQR